MTFKAFMRREKLSIKEVERRSGVPYSTVWRFLNGTGNVAIDSLTQLAAITGGAVTLDDLARELERRRDAEVCP